jgi:hypothetical protein
MQALLHKLTHKGAVEPPHIAFATCRICQRDFDAVVRCNWCGFVGVASAIPAKCGMFFSHDDDAAKADKDRIVRIHVKRGTSVEKMQSLCDDCIAGDEHKM